MYTLNGFKPCYKWNTFNTKNNGKLYMCLKSFKPCYKWNTFNTLQNDGYLGEPQSQVLNLVLYGIPSIRKIINALSEKTAVF